MFALVFEQRSSSDDTQTRKRNVIGVIRYDQNVTGDLTNVPQEAQVVRILPRRFSEKDELQVSIYVRTVGVQLSVRFVAVVSHADMCESRAAASTYYKTSTTGIVTASYIFIIST